MHRNIKLDGIQITVREIVGNAAVGPLDEAAAESVVESIRQKASEVLDAVDYAAEQRRYQADCTEDASDAADINAGAERWETLAQLLREALAT